MARIQSWKWSPCATPWPLGPDRPARTRPSGRLSPGRDPKPIRQLGRADGLLPIFGGAGRPIHAGCPRRRPFDLACLRCAVRRLAGDQPPSGLRERLPRPRPRLPADGWPRGEWRSHRGTRRREVDTGLARHDPRMLGADGRPAGGRQIAGPEGSRRPASSEIGVIQTLAESLNRRLKRRDPLADRVHHTRDAAIGVAAVGRNLDPGVASRLSPHAPACGIPRRMTATSETTAADLEAKVSGSSFYNALRIPAQA